QSCACQRSLTSCMSGADHHDIIIFHNCSHFCLRYPQSCFFFHTFLSLFSCTELTEDLIDQILPHSFPDDTSQSLISIHQVDGEKVLRHSHRNTVFHQFQAFQRFLQRSLLPHVGNIHLIVKGNLTLEKH